MELVCGIGLWEQGLPAMASPRSISYTEVFASRASLAPTSSLPQEVHPTAQALQRTELDPDGQRAGVIFQARPVLPRQVIVDAQLQLPLLIARNLRQITHQERLATVAHATDQGAFGGTGQGIAAVVDVPRTAISIDIAALRTGAPSPTDLSLIHI